MLAVFKMCTVRSDLSSIPPSKFKKTTNARGESCYELKPTLRLSILEDVSMSRLLLLAY